MTRKQATLIATAVILVACETTIRESPVKPSEPATKEVASQLCIRALDLFEESFTHLAESVRGQQAQVDALLVGDWNAFQLGKARYEQAHAKMPPTDAALADVQACRDLAKPVAGRVEVTPPSCLRSLDYFARAFEYLGESIRTMQAQVDALLRRDAEAYLRAKAAYAQAFARVREIDAPLREDHTDCRAKASG